MESKIDVNSEEEHQSIKGEEVSQQDPDEDTLKDHFLEEEDLPDNEEDFPELKNELGEEPPQKEIAEKEAYEDGVERIPEDLMRLVKNEENGENNLKEADGFQDERKHSGAASQDFNVQTNSDELQSAQRELMNSKNSLKTSLKDLKNDQGVDEMWKHSQDIGKPVQDMNKLQPRLIPYGLPDLIELISREVLRQQPRNIVQFIAILLERLVDVRNNKTLIKKDLLNSELPVPRSLLPQSLGFEYY